MSSIRSGQNRVKTITSRFEVLSEQAVVNVDRRPYQRLEPYKSGDSCALEAKGESDDLFGSTGSFGSGRRRLKENQPRTEPIAEASRAWKSESETHEDSSDAGNRLSRQNSDPVKKLHRTPAFRCDRSVKITTTRSPELNVSDRSEQTKARLKKLGSTIQERLMHDDMTFSDYGRLNIKQQQQQPKTAENGGSIPQHILDMYAKVLKPRNRNDANVEKSDSGVSSESENLLVDDAELPSNEPKDVAQELTDESIVDTSHEDEDLDAFIRDKNIVLEGVASVETLKKILKEPLPVGPPPKKPPRTFASLNPPEKQPSPPKIPSNPPPPLNGFKTKKSPRSREESRAMLEKIENAFLKHQSSGKIITPRLEKPNCEGDMSNYNTHPSTASLHQSKKKDMHYMCTELLDLNLTDRMLNSSDGSVASSEDLHNAKSLADCLGSLNCSSGRRRSGFSYTKFGSGPNSLLADCCSCNLTEGQAKCNKEAAALSTFSCQEEPSKCKVCGLNEMRENHFKCHLDCTCKEKNNSTFFTAASPTNPYGSLKKSKSQEHIYDEPIVLRSKRLADETFAGSQTHLEDQFEKYRGGDDGDEQQVTPFVRNDFKSKTLGASNRVGDMKRRLEGRKSEDFGDIRRSEDQDNRHRPITHNGSNMELDLDIFPLVEDQAWGKPPVSDARKPPSLLRPRRPHVLDLAARSPDEIDKRKLNSLISEIYDTVNAACSLESPAEDQPINPNRIERDFHAEYKNYENIVTADPATNHEKAEAALKLTRTLTEKRKAYIRRVSTRRSGDASDIKPRSSGLIKQFSLQDGLPYGTFSSRSKFQKIKSVFEEPPDTDVDYDNKKKIEIPRDEVFAHIENRLFEMCAVIGWNFNTGQAYIRSVFPENATLPPQIESLVFPESCNMESNTHSFTRNTSVYRKARCETLAEDSQLYSLILTNEDGRRSYGYCRRVVPEGAPFCLPLAYCIISNYKAPSLYYKILEEIESHHGSSDVITKSILNQLYNESFPKAGDAISVKNWKAASCSSSIASANMKKNSLHRSSLNLGDFSTFGTKSEENLDRSPQERQVKFDKDPCQRRKSTDLSQKFPNILSGQTGASMIKSLEKIYTNDPSDKNKKSPQGSSYFNRDNKGSVLNRSFILNQNKLSTNVFHSTENTINSDIISIKRSLEPRISEDSLFTLFDTISVDILLKIFGSLLLERKIIIVGDKLSKLSATIEGLQSILYPFIWQHTLISTIPTELRKIIFEAPIPILAGVFCPVDVNQMPSNDIKKNIKNKTDRGSTLPNSNAKKHRDLKEELDLSNFEDGMVIDISSYTYKTKSLIIQMQGDEATILPPSLGKILRTGLQLGSHISLSNSQSKACAQKSANILVAEAFLRFFTTFLEGYENHFTEDPSSQDVHIIFDKEKFTKSFNSKHIQYFLEWFIDSSMFINFIKDQTELHSNPSPETKKMIAGNLPHPDFYDIFNERIAQMATAKQEKESLKHSNVNKSNYKTVMNKKMKVWRDKLKDLVH